MVRYDCVACILCDNVCFSAEYDLDNTETTCKSSRIALCLHGFRLAKILSFCM